MKLTAMNGTKRMPMIPKTDIGRTVMLSTNYISLDGTTAPVMNGFNRVEVVANGCYGMNGVSFNGVTFNGHGVGNMDEWHSFLDAVELGDPYAINGFKDWKAKRQQKKADRAYRKDTRRTARERSKEARVLRRENRTRKQQSGMSLGDKLGNAAQQAAEALGNKVGEMDLQQMAGQYMDAQDQGEYFGPEKGLFSKPWYKKPEIMIPVVAGGAILGFVIFKMVTKKKGRR